MSLETEAERLNGINARHLREYIDSCAQDPSRADRDPVVVGRWVGGTRAEVVSSAGGPPVYMGGPDDPSALGMLLRTLAACDIEVIANKATLLGVEIDELSIEVRGHANVSRYLGLKFPAGPGYEAVDYTVKLKTRGATDEQLAEIRNACVIGSPVGDSLERKVPVRLNFEAS
jgi:uncharacterized OsmC-like protein